MNKIPRSVIINIFWVLAALGILSTYFFKEISGWWDYIFIPCFIVILFVDGHGIYKFFKKR